MELELIQVGWLSVIPPILAIALALITKEVISSLIVGIFSGTLIYACYTAGSIPMIAVKTAENTFGLMAAKMADNINIILFLCLLGALVAVISKTGASAAYGRWASRKLKGKRSAQLATAGLGVLIFIDDYFNCLTVGTVMKPVTDKYRISRAKLAYIIDATAAPVCIIAPISSWAAAVGSNLQATGNFDSTMSAFVSSIPYNLYALLSIGLVIFLCLSKRDFGPMGKVQEHVEQTGDVGAIDMDSSEKEGSNSKGRVFDLIVPVMALIICSVFAMLYTGGLFTGGASTLAEAFGNCDSAASLVMGGFGGLLVAFLFLIPRRVIGFRTFMDCIGEGVKSMVPACIILTLAWTISGVCGDMLGTGAFVGDVFEHLNISLYFVPAIVFVVAALLSFATGTAWGTFGILIPIVMTVMEATTDARILTVALAATLAGSVFGDHCSPISDTTILSSTGAGCSHIQHVSTQMPYALIAAAASFIGYIAAAFSKGNLFITLGSAIVAMALLILLLNKLPSTKKASK